MGMAFPTLVLYFLLGKTRFGNEANWFSVNTLASLFPTNHRHRPPAPNEVVEIRSANKLGMP
jgi:hypothetical protein